VTAASTRTFVVLIRSHLLPVFLSQRMCWRGP
jgi:hypothetical protein